jgi:hypothetical protein
MNRTGMAYRDRGGEQARVVLESRTPVLVRVARPRLPDRRAAPPRSRRGSRHAGAEVEWGRLGARPAAEGDPALARQDPS